MEPVHKPMSVLIVNKNDFDREEYRSYWDSRSAALRHINYGRKYFCLLVNEDNGRSYNINNVIVNDNTVKFLHDEADAIARRDYYRDMNKLVGRHITRQVMKKAASTYATELLKDLQNIIIDYL